MTKMKGFPLNHEFERIYANPVLYRQILKQLADIIAELKRISFSQIGSLKETGLLELKAPIDLLHLNDDNPCSRFSDYARRWLSYYLQEMERLKNSNHLNSRYFQKYIPKLHQLINSPSLMLLDIPKEEFFLSHQDFVMKNILVEGATITAVLDWEWSGSAPFEFESKSGCDFLKTAQDISLFNSMLEEREVFHFFAPPSFAR